MCSFYFLVFVIFLLYFCVFPFIISILPCFLLFFMCFFSSMAQLWQAIQKGYVQSTPPAPTRIFLSTSDLCVECGWPPRNVASLGLTYVFATRLPSTTKIHWIPQPFALDQAEFNCANVSPPSMTSKHRGCYSWFVLATAACRGPVRLPMKPEC